MTFSIKRSNQFKQDFKQCIKRGLSIDEFCKVLYLLQNGLTIPEQYHDHPLQPSKDFKECRELHIKPNWLLVYKYSTHDNVLHLIRTGSHSDLFK